MGYEGPKASNIFQNPGIKNNPGVITNPSIKGAGSAPTKLVDYGARKSDEVKAHNDHAETTNNGSGGTFWNKIGRAARHVEKNYFPQPVKDFLNAKRENQ